MLYFKARSYTSQMKKKDEKNSCLNTLYQVRINHFNRFNIYLTDFLIGKVNIIL